HSALCLGSFTQSPLCLVESSDDDSLIDSEREDKCHYVTISATRRGDSLASDGSKTTTGSSSQMGSDYTYSYVSTYTDGMLCSTLSERIIFIVLSFIQAFQVFLWSSSCPTPISFASY
ncbi:unnamed protein product, partial [Candidula unifasciata]